jgi:hypothetical protein
MKRLRQAQQATAIKADSDRVVAGREALLKQKLEAEKVVLERIEAERARILSATRREEEFRKTPLGRAELLLSNSELGKVRPITVHQDTQRPGNLFIAVRKENGEYLSYTYNPHTGDIRANERIMLTRLGYEETLQALRKILLQ